MNITQASQYFSALAQPTRLSVFKMLVEYGPKGAAAGTLSARLGMAHNSLSFHLSHLTKAGLISATKSGRSMIYTAHIDQIEILIAYLKQNCCTREDEKTHLGDTSE